MLARNGPLLPFISPLTTLFSFQLFILPSLFLFHPGFICPALSFSLLFASCSAFFLFLRTSSIFFFSFFSFSQQLYCICLPSFFPLLPSSFLFSLLLLFFVPFFSVFPLSSGISSLSMTIAFLCVSFFLSFFPRYLFEFFFLKYLYPILFLSFCLFPSAFLSLSQSPSPGIFPIKIRSGQPINISC